MENVPRRACLVCFIVFLEEHLSKRPFLEEGGYLELVPNLEGIGGNITRELEESTCKSMLYFFYETSIMGSQNKICRRKLEVLDGAS